MKMDLFNPFSNSDLISNCPSNFDYGHCNEFSNRSFQYCNPRSLSASDLFTPNVFVTIPLQNQSPTNNNSINNNNTNVTNNTAINNSNVLPNINTNYTNLNYNNSSNKNGNEIKSESEPIKIEMSENNQNRDKPVSTVSIISSTIITSNSNNNQSETINCKPHLHPLPSSNSLLVTARPKNPVICYKCDKCPFISISQNCLRQHYDQNHEEFIKNTTKKLSCPGCDNIFYIRKSLETHLLNDHQMNMNEIETLVNCLIDSIDCNSLNDKCNEIDTAGNLIVPQKNRISIKNVKILQNPNLINSNELFNDTFGQSVNIGDSTANSNCSNQKIYLKNPIYLLNNNNTNKIFEQPILPSLHLSSTTPSPSPFDSIFNEQNFIEMGHNSDVSIEDVMHDQNNYIIDLNGNSNSNYNTNMISDDKHGMNGQQQQNNNGLHLRTVDELNLLDLTDVENNFVMNCNRETPSSDNQSDKVVVLQQCNIVNNTNVLDTAANTDDNFIFIEPDNEMDQNGYEDDDNIDNDDNINFVCAEEIINENQFENEFNGATTHTITDDVFGAMDSDNFEAVKKNRGRPKGSKQTGITHLKKMYVNLTAKEIGYKCSIPLCAMRFQNNNVLIYHERCHSSSNSDVIICPECTNDNRAWNWNTLHTHLWRCHNIDMELHSCKLCNFKTPILSRLNNTHIKIHSAERNFKCDQCDKAFKNTKQLKNHRRLHRINNQVINHEYKKCPKCSSIFKDVDLLKNHMEHMHSNTNTLHKNNNNNSCANKTTKFKCPNCDKVTNSKSNLKLHIMIHMDNKKFKCDKDNCFYATNDHNAFRRHKMKHNQNKRYKCSFCNYTSIQSTTFKNHILKNHVSKAPDLVFQCKLCRFVTINRQKYSLHLKKHGNNCDGDSNITDKLIDDTTNFIDLEELDEEKSSHNELDQQTIAATTTISSDNSLNNNDNIILSSTIDQPLIRPAVFANNFSNIENFRFTKILDLNDKFDTVNFSNIYNDEINYNHFQENQSDNLDTVVRVQRMINDGFDDNNKECFNIDLT